MFAAVGSLAIDDARACWHDDAVWHLADGNDFGGDYTSDEYFAMLGRFFERYGEGYQFRVDEIREHGELVVCFAGSSQPELDATDGVLIYRVRDGLIVEGWGIGRGADSLTPW